MNKCASCQREYPFTKAYLKQKGKYCPDCLVRIHAMTATRRELRIKTEARETVDDEIREVLNTDNFELFVVLKSRADRLDKEIIRAKNKLTMLIKSCPVYVELDIDRILNQHE